MKPYRFFTVCILSCFLCSALPAQLTIEITSVPAETPPNADIYIAGNFNAWNPGDANYKLTNNGNGTYTITFSPTPGTLEYKFTRGSWDTVEGNASGGFLPNRTYNYPGGVQSIEVTIVGWEDVSGLHTAEDNVEILDADFYIPQLDRMRRIWIYLPPDYHTSSKHYPVIYMHDGQNLFDAFYSFAGEWEIDESMNELFDMDDYGAIVVGIDNGGGERINEYSPWYNPGYGGGDGEAYASFLVETLKPHIDSTFRTRPGREYTAVAGSSMGGNISMYTIAEYPNIFSKAGIFSPAFWFSDSIYPYVESKTFTEPIRVYFVASENEGASVIANMLMMYELLLEEGIAETDLLFLNEPDGAHSEWFWAREYPDAYKWLFENNVLSTSKPTQKKIELHPNPTKDVMTISSEMIGMKYKIYNAAGLPVMNGELTTTQIPVSALRPGWHFLELKDRSGNIIVNRFVKL